MEEERNCKQELEDLRYIAKVMGVKRSPFTEAGIIEKIIAAGKGEKRINRHRMLRKEAGAAQKIKETEEPENLCRNRRKLRARLRKRKPKRLPSRTQKYLFRS